MNLILNRTQTACSSKLFTHDKTSFPSSESAMRKIIYYASRTAKNNCLVKINFTALWLTEKVKYLCELVVNFLTEVVIWFV